MAALVNLAAGTRVETMKRFRSLIDPDKRGTHAVSERTI
jgi:hypothetical protein